MINITNFNFKELNKFNKIFVLVSGGIDSTYLAEIIMQECDQSKIFFVNSYNPYEQSETLNYFRTLPNFIEIKPDEEYDYAEILRQAFLQIPKAKKLFKEKRYNKKIFKCCYFIKHKSFLNNKLFLEDNTVVVSGIKKGDGKQRSIWLTQLKKNGTFYHKHRMGQLYCYPFRDYRNRELPDEIISDLKKKYPSLEHSGCIICPIVVMFDIKTAKKQYYPSIRYYNNLFNQKNIKDFL